MKSPRFCFGLIALAGSWAVHAALPTSGAYVSDPQSEYVQDQTSEGASMASMILCFMANTRPDAMVNLGPYVAFIDESKCSSDKASASNSSSQGSGSSIEYTRMRLTSTRASNTSAQIVKGHASISMGPSMDSYVYMHASATGAPSDTAPNGLITMNMSGLLVSGGTKVMRGRINATADQLDFAMTQSSGSGSDSFRMYVRGDDSSGTGAMQIPNPSGGNLTFTFGYNSTTFCRAVGSSPAVCFDRAKANAKTSVWRYGVYDDDTGAAYDLAVPGFPVKHTSTNEYGYAGYWGIWFPTAVSNGDALVSLDSPATRYTVVKTGGRLNRVTNVTSTLDGVSKIPFNFVPRAASTTVTTGEDLLASNNYEAYWDAANGYFVISGVINAGYKESLSVLPVTATKADMKNAMSPSGDGTNSMGIQGWSQALGGNLSIPVATLDASDGTGAVKYSTQTLVSPGDTGVPDALKCAMNCPTYALLNAAGSTLSKVYTDGTKYKGGYTAAADVVSYTWNPSTYALSESGNSLANSLLTGKNLPADSAWGIRTGALVDARSSSTAWNSGGVMDCDISGSPGSAFCDFKANDEVSTYYIWEMGKEDWQSATFLKKSDDTFVAFTAPQSAILDVPNQSSTYGEFAGARMNLQFGGSGNLWGIPGKCFDPSTNEAGDCDANMRYVPAFSIPENSSSSQLGKVTINGATKWVKYLDREIRFNPVTAVSITMGNAALLPDAMVLTGVDAEDPSNSANTDYYAGAITADDFKAAPSVIHGVVQ